MAVRVYKDGELVEKYSAVTGSIQFIEANEKEKPGGSLYNIEPKEEEQ